MPPAGADGGMSKRGADERSIDGARARAKRVRSAQGATVAEGDGRAFRLREPAAPAHTAAAPPAMVLAPAFRPVHASWAAFDEALKLYAQSTHQLYVIRTTTSVTRRNQRIAEGVSAPPERLEESGAASTASTTSTSASASASATSATAPSERALIPERFEWYSKTLMCTHGWKSRQRGSGKRSMASVRSTGCPARMCVTLQQRAGGTDWQVVVTKHTRQHNHPLSKELYFYYLENRRIYDPELLAVGGGGCAAPPLALPDTWPPSADPRELLAADGKPPVVAPAPAPASAPAPVSALETRVTSSSAEVARIETSLSASAAPTISEAAGGEFVLRADTSATFVHATRASIKVHESWEAFGTYMADYSEATNQVFRTRSTISVAAKNARTIERSEKAGRPPEDTAALLIPEELKWYSKMLICCYGWKRKSRRKLVSSYYGAALSSALRGDKAGDSDVAFAGRKPCPATLFVRLERDADGQWRVVINRQVVEHNHTLALDAYDADEAAAGIVQPSAGPAAMRADGGIGSGGHGLASGSRDQGSRLLATESQEMVVRVPRLQSTFLSWEDFHEHLRLYSDATYQLYCTRTTTSVANRNRKIMALKRQFEAERGAAGAPAAAESNNDTRVIPDEWQWYNKTLMCTHGWKRRPRGEGKRAAQVVRSTLCPVKICATLQFVENVGGSTGADAGGGWRVVITKHIVDHNHNLSRELYEHYRENRRIYNADLLTIDESSGATVVKARTPAIEISGSACPPAYLQASAASAATSSSAAIDPGELQQSPNDAAYPESAGASDGASFLQVGVSPTAQPIPSVVILPYQPSLPATMTSTAAAPSERLMAAASGSSSDRPSSSAVSTGSAVATLAALAAPQPQMYVPYHSPEAMGSGGAILMSGVMPDAGRHGLPGANFPAGSAMFSLSCPVHNGSGVATADHANGGGDACSCFRLAPSAAYVTIAPSRAAPLMTRMSSSTSFELPAHGASEHGYERVPMASDTVHDGGEPEPDADLEPANGAWRPGAPVEIAPPTASPSSGEALWRVPPMAHRHASWAAFHAYLDAYSAATFQLFSVRTTTAVSSRNARILQQMASKSAADGASEAGVAPPTRQLEASAQMLPSAFEWYAKTFLCTHGWKRRRRGEGKRVGHNVRSTQCPAKICATLQRPLGAGPRKWRVVVTKQELAHNHEVSRAMYQKYSASRRVKDPALLRAAERLWRAGASRRQVLEFIKERAPQVPILMKDVHNIVQRWKKSPPTDGQSDEGRDARPGEPGSERGDGAGDGAGDGDGDNGGDGGDGHASVGVAGEAVGASDAH